MFYLFLGILLLQACEQNINRPLALSTLKQELQFSPASLDEEVPQKITITAQEINLKGLRKALLLTKYIGKDQLVESDIIEKLDFTLKSIKVSNAYELKPKLSLIGGFSYGLYYCENKLCKIKHKIYIKRAPPKLLKHDLGIGEVPVVAKNRLHFSFTFDQKIYLTYEQAIQIKSLEGQVLEVAHVMVKSSRVEVELKPHQGRAQGHYYFQFENVANADSRYSSKITKNFIMGGDEAALGEYSPVKILYGSHGLEFSWSLNNAHVAELFFGEDRKGFDCLGGNCPRDLPTTMVSSRGHNSFLSHVFLDNLRPETKYHVIVRARDNQGKILLAGGVLKTSAPSGISLSEVFVAPKISTSDNAAEFIEYYNFSELEREFIDARLVLEDQGNHSAHLCDLSNKAAPLKWPAQSYLLIVGSDFDESIFNIPEKTQIIRLKQKTLCGGLSNKKAKNITLVAGENSILDRYSGHLWLAPLGQSINKLNLEGLDEADNYCYSKSDYGPTPGARAGPC